MKHDCEDNRQALRAPSGLRGNFSSRNPVEKPSEIRWHTVTLVTRYKQDPISLSPQHA
jgi:hypothetical protein